MTNLRTTLLTSTICIAVIVVSNVVAAPPVFEKDVSPILTERCGKCHADQVGKGELDLSSISGIRRGGESGNSVVGRTLDESLLWTLVNGGDMPPQGEPPLTDDEKRVIRHWIESGAAANAPAETSKEHITQHDMLPIVLLRCVVCHGATLKQAGVDLRTVAGMRMGGANGPALIAGDASASLMIQRIESEACPPEDQLLKHFVKRPPASEVRLIRDWISDGARECEISPDVATAEPDQLVTDEDRRHWAFQPPKRLPGAHSIDTLIGAALERSGLTFSPEAERDTLIRRACLDLTGLPPDPDAGQR